MSMSAAFDAVVGVAHSAIEGLAALLTPITAGASVAVAIILFTVAVRLLISPLTYLQIRGERRRAALAPHLADLQRKHRDDPAILAAETLALYRANRAGPLAGLWPGLAQAPFFMIMYRVVALNAPAGSLVGIPLSAHLFAGVPAFAVLLAIALTLAWLSSRRIRRAGARKAPVAGPGARGSDATAPAAGRSGAAGSGAAGSGAAGSGAGSADGSAASPPGALAAIMPLLPFATVPVVAWLPLAGALYLVTSMAWTALERSAAVARPAPDS